MERLKFERSQEVQMNMGIDYEILKKIEPTKIQKIIAVLNHFKNHYLYKLGLKKY